MKCASPAHWIRIRTRLLPAVLLTLATYWPASGQTYTISTFAGGGLPLNIPGTSASLYAPWAVAADKAGNVFFVDRNDVLRLEATTGVLMVVAGTGTLGFSGDNGPAASAQFDYPEGVAVDSAGNLYIADTENSRIRKVSNGVVTTVAGNGTQGFSGDNGPATSAGLFPVGVAVDSAGNLYVVDNCRIRKVSNGVITTVAGNGTPGFSGDNGPAISSELSYPGGVAVDSAGNLYIADTGNNRIRKVANGVITTVAGIGTVNGTQGFSGDNGPATTAQLSTPVAVAVDSIGNLYISDYNNHRIREVAGGVITTVAGNGTDGFSGDNGPATSADLSFPVGVAVDPAGSLYLADIINRRIRKVANGVITTAAGGGFALGDNGPATSGELNGPEGVAVDAAGNLYIADTGNNRIRKVANGAITTAAGNGTPGFSGDNGPAASAQLSAPKGVAVDSAGSVYIADTGNSTIRKISNGVITTVAGNGTQGFSGDNGPATSAQLDTPFGLAVDLAGNLYIADTNNGRVRKVSNGVITTVAGDGGEEGSCGDSGPATSAQLDAVAVAVDSAGNIYIAGDCGYLEVSNGIISTVGDTGPDTCAGPSEHSGLAVDSDDNLYIAAYDNSRVCKVANGVITTLAGNGTVGFGGDNGPATSAALASPAGLAIDPAGNIYVSDENNNNVRLLTPGMPPAINPGGIVPNDSPVPVIQPGSWVSIYGTNLASGTFLWNGDFPTSLAGVSVTINNKLAYLWYISPTQINLQAPDDTAPGSVSVVITTPFGTAASTATLAPYGPSFSLLGDGKHVAGEIATPNGTGAYGGGTYDLVGPAGAFSFPTRPVKAGEVLVLFGVGFGPTTPSVPAGKIFSGAAPTNSPVTITIGGVTANVAFSGITEAGLYQLNLIVPPNTGSGDQALQATIKGVQTPPGPLVTVQ